MGGAASSAASSTVLATLAPVHSSAMMFPGNHSVDLCLCASGGGARALSFTLGVYRALQRLGVLSKLDALSSVSGGTWASSVYMFGKKFRGQDISTEALLGIAGTAAQPEQPQELTLATLSRESPPLAVGFTEGRSTKALVKNAASGLLSDSEVWTQTVAELALENFGLESLDSCMALSDSEVERIKAENPALKETKFCTPRSDRPSLFIMNGALLAPTNFLPHADAVVSFQVSPDFCGSPFYPMDAMLEYFPEVTFMPAPFCCITPCCRSNLMLPVGGGLVETFAFGGTAPETMPVSTDKVLVGRPGSCFSLAEAIGISSFAPAARLAAAKIKQRKLAIKKEYWPVIGGQMVSPLRGMATSIPAHEYQFGDGGNIENSGLLPLLQRDAKNVIWIATSYRALSTTYDFENVTQENFDPEAALVIDQLFSAFGYGTNDEAAGFFYGHNQVFEKTLLLPIVQRIARLKKAGKPAVIKETLEVQQNKYWGIRGGYRVSLVLIYLETVSDFQEQLPEETRQDISKGADGAFANYPIYLTNNNNGVDTLDLTSAQVNLLAAQGEYTVLQSEDLIRQLVQAAGK